MIKTLLLLLLLLSIKTELYGCGCDLIPFEEATEWADEIFLGRLIEVREINSLQGLDGYTNTNTWGALFEVEKKWKGSNSKYVEVLQYGGSCDFNFEFPAQPYIVYAKEGKIDIEGSTKPVAGLVTSLCRRNASAYTYYLMDEDGFDDRERLDVKYKAITKLHSFYLYWKWLAVGSICFLLGVLLGRITNPKS